MTLRRVLTTLTLITAGLTANSAPSTPAGFETKVQQAHIAAMISEKLQKDRGTVPANGAKGVFGLLATLNRNDDCHDDGGDNGDKVSCMDAVCGKMPRYNCDDASELQQVGQVCRGVSGDCIIEACKHLPSYACDDLSELTRIAGICKRNHGTCMKEMCDRMPSYNCDDVSELEKVGEACRGVRSGCVTSICKRLQSYECDDLSELIKVGESCRGN